MRHAYFAITAAIALSCAAHAQTATQSTVISKQSFDNPTICVQDFTGSMEQRQRFEGMLQRCGWFTVIQPTQAKQAQIRVSAQMTTAGSANQFVASIQHNGKAYPVSASDADSNLAIFKGTDAILKTVFGIPPICSRKIAFVRHQKNQTKEIYACYIDGSGQERLTFNKAISTEPAWGHSQALVYTLAQNNSLAIVLMDYANKRQKIISHTKGLNSSAALSPDGQHVALTLSRDKFVDLYVLNLVSGKYTRLTRDNSVESSPCWSPDGSQICFVSDAMGIGAPRLYIVDANGSSPAKRLSIGGGISVSPDWSRLNNKLCYSTRGSYGKYVIATLDMNTANPTPQIITAADGDWEAPSWAPDGRHIICTRALKGERNIVTVDAQSGAFNQITSGAVLSLPSWQPAR